MQPAFDQEWPQVECAKTKIEDAKTRLWNFVILNADLVIRGAYDLAFLTGGGSDSGSDSYGSDISWPPILRFDMMTGNTHRALRAAW